MLGTPPSVSTEQAHFPATGRREAEIAHAATGGDLAEVGVAGFDVDDLAVVLVDAGQKNPPGDVTGTQRMTGRPADEPRALSTRCTS